MTTLRDHLSTALYHLEIAQKIVKKHPEAVTNGGVAVSSLNAIVAGVKRVQGVVKE